jgi:hypothetical protein
VEIGNALFILIIPIDASKLFMLELLEKIKRISLGIKS